MGLQNAAARHVGVPDLTTTVLTLTLTGLAADSNLAGGNNPRVGRRLLATGAMFLGAGVGAFLVLRPRARIVTLFPLVVYWAMAEIPAALFLPVWFVMQFLNGFLALAAAQRTQEAIGVAWWAHVGGFLFGAAVGMGVRWGRREVRGSEDSGD